MSYIKCLKEQAKEPSWGCPALVSCSVYFSPFHDTASNKLLTKPDDVSQNLLETDKDLNERDLLGVAVRNNACEEMRESYAVLHLSQRCQPNPWGALVQESPLQVSKGHKVVETLEPCLECSDKKGYHRKSDFYGVHVLSVEGKCQREEQLWALG